jgi:hypothetical protein
MNKARAFLLAIPLSIAPLAAQAKSFADIVNKDIVPFGNTIVKLIYALCFIFFLIGMVQYFMSHNAETRQKGRQFAIYGLAALVILFVVWGLVQFLIGILSSFST